MPSLFASFHFEPVSLGKSIARLLRWGMVLSIGVVNLRLPTTSVHLWGAQVSVAFALMAVSLFGTPVGVGVVAVSWAPAWPAYIVGSAFALFVISPNVLASLSWRRAAGGYPRAAAFYARLLRLLYPPRQLACTLPSWPRKRSDLPNKGSPHIEY